MGLVLFLYGLLVVVVFFCVWFNEFDSFSDKKKKKKLLRKVSVLEGCLIKYLSNQYHNKKPGTVSSGINILRVPELSMRCRHLAVHIL